MQKVVTYLYPEADIAASLKVFQDRTSQIKAFYFTREHIKKVSKLDSGNNYAVYFLFDKTNDNEMTKVYIGQSRQGAGRMDTHNKLKMFWSFCIMFVTDNNSFDAMTIDYMEYHFINKLRNSSSYSLENKDMRKSEPVVSIFDKPNIMALIDQIEFLLKAEGINFIEQNTIDQSNMYYPKNKNYNARITSAEGKFILLAGSYIKRPIDSARQWADDGRFYQRYSELIQSFLEDEKIADRGEYYETLVNLSFNSPSMVASLISGMAENGWIFFEKLNELRE